MLKISILELHEFVQNVWVSGVADYEKTIEIDWLFLHIYIYFFVSEFNNCSDMSVVVVFYLKASDLIDKSFPFTDQSFMCKENLVSPPCI